MSSAGGGASHAAEARRRALLRKGKGHRARFAALNEAFQHLGRPTCTWQEWQPEDLIEVWTLLEDDMAKLRNKSRANRLGFVLLRLGLTLLQDR
ncbi:hypothetical protein OHB53_08760 [Streptomyces sp. NBC_00056]|uniref:hypothetical protein n=1 Tax=Streptomyces sp. NBC_00056 TaxID=2975633 RepID=UPI00324FB5C2